MLAEVKLRLGAGAGGLWAPGTHLHAKCCEEGIIVMQLYGRGDPT